MAMKVTSEQFALPPIPAHPFIVNIEEVFKTSNKTSIIMEYITGGI